MNGNNRQWSASVVRQWATENPDKLGYSRRLIASILGVGATTVRRALPKGERWPEVNKRSIELTPLPDGVFCDKRTGLMARQRLQRFVGDPRRRVIPRNDDERFLLADALKQCRNVAAY